jgi:predicted alpha-1,2-mannosidase
VAHAQTTGEPGDFATSFEERERSPLEDTVAERDGAAWQRNVTGSAGLLPGSVLGLLENVTASAENAPNEPAAALADGNPGTKWLAFAPTGWVAYEFAEPVTLAAYALTSGNDVPGRDPADWTLQGSADGETWTTVDQRTGESFAERGEHRVFELDEPAPGPGYQHYRLNITANAGASILQLADWDLSADLDAAPEQTPMVTALGSGPTGISWTNKTDVGFTGLRSLRYGGEHVEDGPAYATNVLFEDVSLDVGEHTRLSYKILPEFLDDLGYPSTYSAVDLRFTDGSYLSELDARDVYGTGSAPRAQGEGKILYADQWNSVRVDLGSVAAGRTVDQVLFGYHNPDGEADTRFGGWLDDIELTAEPETIDGSSLTHYVDTRRGTFSTGSFSRGNNIPATAVPNGFNFWVPMTNADSQSWLYDYQKGNNANNKPVLEGLGISHEPSPWMGDRNQLSFLPADGSAAVPDGSLGARGLEFDHADETAQPDYYGVNFTSGLSTEVTPTDHGAVLRFGYPEGTGTGQVLVDKVAGDAKLSFAGDGTLSGWVDNGSGLSAGRSRMFVAGEFDAEPATTGTAAGSRDAARYAAFELGSDRTVELRVATSFISQDQARANLALEVTGRDFEEIREDARAAWNERLSVIEVAGAGEDQLVTLYSSLYRLNLYPNSQFENTGTAEEPVHQYASPVSPKTGDATDTHTNAQITDGKIYVNNGFWDTYRTAWPAYSLLYPDMAEELVDGFVQQYRDGGWVARWSSPGYADLMTGTSSDVSFADAYVKGALPTDLALEAYDAALKNATVIPANAAVGRKGLDRSPFLGYTAAGTHESVSWGLEGFINDFGIGTMAAALAEDPATPDGRREQLREESGYLLERATQFVGHFDPAIDFFQTRHADGTFVVPPEEYNPENWGGGYTETSGWNFAFHAPQDGQGLANLYGGKAGLEAKLDTFFSTPERGAGSGGIHEQREARDVRMGQWGMSNQVAHHIPFLYNAAGAPAKAQEKTREVLRRLFTGNDIGQGYPGDEDNGEMSAWWIFGALGLYPLQVGSAEYTVGSPLFEQATVHLPDGDLVVRAPGNSDSDIYVQSLRVNGEAHSSTSISHADLTGGTVLDFEMGPEPSAWGTGPEDAPPSLTDGDQPPQPAQDVTGAGLGTLTSSDGTEVTALTDDSSVTDVRFDSSAPALSWTGNGIRPTFTSYTLTSGPSGGAAPSGWTLEGSDDGENWTVLDERSGEEFRWAVQTRPFLLSGPVSHQQLRLTVTETAGEGELALSEVEFLADPAASDSAGLTVTPARHLSVPTGRELTGRLATVTGVDAATAARLADDPGGYQVEVSFGDGGDPATGTLTPARFGAYAVTAPYTWSVPGVYPVTVSVTGPGGDGEETTVSAVAEVTVSLLREGSLLAAFDNRCVGEDGAGADCDGQGVSFDRAQLAAEGFVPGERGSVPGTELEFDLPATAPGEPDNATGEGQTIELELPEDATELSVIGTGTERNQQAEGVLTFDDGSTAPIDLSFGDWTGTANSPAFGNIPVAVTANRLSDGHPTGLPAAVFATSPMELPDGRRAVSLTLPEQSGTLRNDGRIHVFALAHNGTFTDHAPLTAEPAADLTVTEGETLSEVLATARGGRAEGPDGYRASVSWGDGSDVAAGAVSADGDAVRISGEHSWAEPGEYTVHIAVDDGWQGELVSLQVTVEAAVPELDVVVTAYARCIGGKAHLAVRALNAEDTPLAIELSTPYGEHTFPRVVPGRTAHRSFNTRLPAVDDGTVTISASAADGEVTIEVPYSGVTCGG